MATQEPLSFLLPDSDWAAPSEFPDLSGQTIGLDLETRDERLKTHGPGGVRSDGCIAGVSVHCANFTGYFPTNHSGGGNLDDQVVFDWLRSQLPTVKEIVGAHILYDLEWLKAERDIQVKVPIHDIQIAESLLDETRASYSLDAIAKDYLGTGKEELLLQQAASSWNVDPKGGLWQLPARFVGGYAEWDAWAPVKIWEKQQGILEEQELWEAYTLEQELLPLLLDMRFQGVKIDVDKAEQLKIKFKAVASEAQRLLNEITGLHVDVGSAPSLSKVYEAKGIWFPHTDKGNPSFTADWLSEQDDDISQLVIDVRTYTKGADTFIDNMILDKLVDGRIYCEFHQAKGERGGTETGRFSSSNPNLQQVPKHHPVIGPAMRSLFIPDTGAIWCKHDYRQQEPRVTVHYAVLMGYAGAEEAQRRYIEDPTTDYHQMVADMADMERRPAKEINLGIPYGMGIPKLATMLNCDVLDAAEFYKQYTSAVPYAKLLMDFSANRAAEFGYIKTITGRRRRFNKWEARGRDAYNLDSGMYTKEAALEKFKDKGGIRRSMTYKALNSAIQGSSADMIKKAMVAIYKEGYVPHITLHDEVDTSIDGPRQALEIDEIMCTCVKLKVPLATDIGMGPSWGELDEMDRKEVMAISKA